MLKKTNLYQAHSKLGAKFVEFGGWDMPVRFSGQIEEHHAVRNNVGIFDVSHMGEIFVRGPRATEFINKLASNDISKIPVGRAQYALLLNPQGGVVDDIISYKFSDDNFLICVNASNTQKDWEWLNSNKISGIELENRSEEFSQIAIQGPNAYKILAKVLDYDIKDLDLTKFRTFSFRTKESGYKQELIIARTGYTGEDGFEIFCPNEGAEKLWNAFLNEGAAPIGLGARDTLRLEAALPLHGHELTDELSALTSNMVWAIKFAKNDFIGKSALVEQRAKGIPYHLHGFEVLDKGIVRQDAKIYNQKDQEVGWVSSGTLTPTLNKAIALGFINRETVAEGSEAKLFADVRGKKLALKEHSLPFIKKNAA